MNKSKGEEDAGAASAEKRRAVLDVILPTSTSDRAAQAARAAVVAISSEKTLEQIHVAEGLAQVEEEERSDALADLLAPAPPAEERRCARDPYGPLRAELARPEDDPQDPHAPWRMANHRLRHELFPGATQEELKSVEARLGVTLPPSFWDFSLEWNGGTLYVGHDGGYRIVPAPDIINEVKGALCNRMTRPHLPVVDLGCGDYLALDVSEQGKNGEHPLVWWYGGEARRKVAPSFAHWVRKLVECKGRPFWWEVEA